MLTTTTDRPISLQMIKVKKGLWLKPLQHEEGGGKEDISQTLDDDIVCKKYKNKKKTVHTHTHTKTQ